MPRNRRGGAARPPRGGGHWNNNNNNNRFGHQSYMEDFPPLSPSPSHSVPVPKNVVPLAAPVVSPPRLAYNNSQVSWQQQHQQYLNYHTGNPIFQQGPSTRNYNQYQGSYDESNRVQRINMYENPVQQQSAIYSQAFLEQVPPNILGLLKIPGEFPRGNPYLSNSNNYEPRFRWLFEAIANDNTAKSQRIDQDALEFRDLPVEYQLEEFLIARSLTIEESRLRWQFVSDLRFILKEFHPNCELYTFGSLRNGLADQTSDIDIYADLFGENTGSFSGSLVNNQEQTPFQLVKKILKNRGRCPHTGGKFLHLFVPISKARVPIMKMIHFSQIQCDISFENRLSVQNTKMLKFYMALDPKICSFFKLIRYWGKYHNLTGSSAMKNYALILLALTYLCKRSLVPSVALLQSWKASERRRQNILFNTDEVGDWDASFYDDLEFVRKSFQKNPYPGCTNRLDDPPSDVQILISMVLEFCEMYANVDFSKVVICPLIGDVVPKEYLAPENEASLPQPFERYVKHVMKDKANKDLRFDTEPCFCVQDPFQLCYNVGKVTTQVQIYKFQIACAKAYQTLKDVEKLNSLLDLFIPLPTFLEGKKFKEDYKASVKMRDLEKEIKTVLGVKLEDKERVCPPTLNKSAPGSSYVKLPEHISHLTHLLNNKLHSWKGKGTFTHLIEFTLGEKFEAIFLTEVSRHKTIRNQPEKWKDVIATLWKQFTMDFCSQFLEQGLLFEIKTDEKKIVDGCNDNGKWVLDRVTKIPDNSTVLALKETNQTESFLKKLNDLEKTTKQTHHRMISFEISYPFWEDRKSYFAEANKSQDIINIPLLAMQGKQKNQKPKQQQQQPKAPYSIIKSSDPVVFQAYVGRKMKNAQKPKSFKTFVVTLLMKLVYGQGDFRPRANLILEKDNVEKNVSHKHVETAMLTLSNLIRQALHDYTYYRLAKWINSPEPEPATDNKKEEDEQMSFIAVGSDENVGEEMTDDKISKPEEGGQQDMTDYLSDISVDDEDENNEENCDDKDPDEDSDGENKERKRRLSKSSLVIKNGPKTKRDSMTEENDGR